MSAHSHRLLSVADHKAAEIQALRDGISGAQHEIRQLQAAVTALSAKAATVASFLAQAEANLASAAEHIETGRQVADRCRALIQSTAIMRSQAALAQHSADASALKTAQLISKLIRTLEVTDRLGSFVSKAAATGHPIPEALISSVAKAAAGGHVAVDLALKSLASSQAAAAAGVAAQHCIATGSANDRAGTGRQTGDASRGTGDVDGADLAAGAAFLLALLGCSHDQEQRGHRQALAARRAVTAQLDDAQSRLDAATARLNALKAGLAAAQAAAAAT
jgi:hypothetical protein